MTTQIHSTPKHTDRSVATLPTSTPAEELAERFRPLRDQMLVKLDELPKQVGLIHLPDTATNHEPRWATVVKVGPGIIGKSGRREPCEFGVGARVLLGKDPGWELADGFRVLGTGAATLAEER